jgi:hypothetical protein
MRYFIISFSFRVKQTEESEGINFGDGNLALQLETYPNLTGIIKTVTEQDPNLENITILNIQELSEQDFKDFTE